MNILATDPNLVFGWLGILLGFLSGLVLGAFFHRENWLGGYASFKRRLYRLAHISFFGLGATNLLFFHTVWAGNPGPALTAAAWAFITGAALMPVCCLVMAHWPRARMLFLLPVGSLIAGALLTLLKLLSI